MYMWLSHMLTLLAFVPRSVTDPTFEEDSRYPWLLSTTESAPVPRYIMLFALRRFQAGNLRIDFARVCHWLLLSLRKCPVE